MNCGQNKARSKAGFPELLDIPRPAGDLLPGGTTTLPRQLRLYDYINSIDPESEKVKLFSAENQVRIGHKLDILHASNGTILVHSSVLIVFAKLL